MEILMKQKGITLVCLPCGCVKKILPGEIPDGDCGYCRMNFGWVLFPDRFRLQYKEGDEILEDGDVVIVDTKLPVESPDRIYEVIRHGLVWYSREAKV